MESNNNKIEFTFENNAEEENVVEKEETAEEEAAGGFEASEEDAEAAARKYYFRHNRRFMLNPKREDFRKYLQQSGVLEVIAKFFSRLYEEQVEDPIAELSKINNKKFEMEIHMLKLSLEKSQADVEDLKQQNEILKIEAEELKKMLNESE